MKGIKTVVNIIGLVVKYGAVLMAVVKGLQLIQDELSKIEIKGAKDE